MKLVALVIVTIVCAQWSFAQVEMSSIHTPFVMQAKRERHERYIRDTVINRTFAQPLDSNTEYDYETACLSVSQFMIRSPQVEKGFNTLFRQYESLQYSTKAAFLEAIYGLYPKVFQNDVRIIMLKENNPKLFAMQALYLLAADGGKSNKQALLTTINQRFPQAGRNNILLQLRDYINNHANYIATPTPPVTDLFALQKHMQQKTIYSLQRWNRDYPGIAILQNADGSFARDSAGKLLVIQQLARSASNLPYFITDGNTPAGVYAITGLSVSRNNFLGPTPNIQMVMPYEDDEAYWGDVFDVSKDTLWNYLNQLPPSWQQYAPITEAYWAGKIGRRAVIAHGTTLNPTYFANKPYYPISPTLGCLCAKEIWNPATGTLVESEQLKLVNAFIATPGDIGYVIVINLDDKQAPVTSAEVEALVKGY